MSKLRPLALLAGLGLGLVVSLGGCARHVIHHHPKPAPTRVVVLDREHDDRTVVIVHERPRPERRCWKHAGHWHCRAR